MLAQASACASAKNYKKLRVRIIYLIVSEKLNELLFL
jgi:hypothetical protein